MFDSSDEVSLQFRRYQKQGGNEMAHDIAIRLAEIRQIYEDWATAVSASPDSCPALLVPDPVRPVPGIFRLFTAGPALSSFMDGLNGFCSSWPERLGDAHRDLISAFFDDLRGWIAASGYWNSVSAGPDVSRALDEHIKALAKAGFVVGARERFLLLTGGIDAEPLSWRIIDIKVQLAFSLRSPTATP